MADAGEGEGDGDGDEGGIEGVETTTYRRRKPN